MPFFILGNKDVSNLAYTVNCCVGRSVEEEKEKTGVLALGEISFLKLDYFYNFYNIS